jgi:hypothetical protein
MATNNAGIEVSGAKNPNWKGGSINKVCEVCGGAYSVKRAHAKSRFCSLQCVGISQRGKPKKKCDSRKKRAYPSASERLAAKSVERPGGCIEYTGRCNENGYGTIGENGKTWLAHRLAWTLAKGPVPDDLGVLHSCDNPPCINVNHLFLGTHADNMQDMVKKGRGVQPGLSGEANPNSKLSAADVQAIRAELADAKRKDGTGGRLAKLYGVSESVISGIKSGKRYAAVGNGS